MENKYLVSGEPFSFDIPLNTIAAGDIVSVILHTYRFSTHLHGRNEDLIGSNDDPDGEIGVTAPVGAKAATVSVSGEKCRLLPLGFIRMRCTVHGSDGKAKQVVEDIVGEIISKIKPHCDVPIQ